MSNFFFCHDVFNKRLLQMCQRRLHVGGGKCMLMHFDAFAADNLLKYCLYEPSREKTNIMDSSSQTHPGCLGYLVRRHFCKVFGGILIKTTYAFFKNKYALFFYGVTIISELKQIIGFIIESNHLKASFKFVLRSIYAQNKLFNLVCLVRFTCCPTMPRR